MSVTEDLRNVEARVAEIRERLVAVETNQESHEDADTQRHAESVAAWARMESTMRWGFGACVGLIALSMILVAGVSGVARLGGTEFVVGEASAAAPPTTTLVP